MLSDAPKTLQQGVGKEGLVCPIFRSFSGGSVSGTPFWYLHSYEVRCGQRR